MFDHWVWFDCSGAKYISEFAINETWNGTWKPKRQTEKLSWQINASCQKEIGILKKLLPHSANFISNLLTRLVKNAWQFDSNFVLTLLLTILLSTNESLGSFSEAIIVTIGAISKFLNVDWPTAPFKCYFGSHKHSFLLYSLPRLFAVFLLSIRCGRGTEYFLIDWYSSMSPTTIGAFNTLIRAILLTVSNAPHKDIVLNWVNVIRVYSSTVARVRP